jgi:hypothetical protein
MSFTPPPPPGFQQTPTTYQQMASMPAQQNAFRRPRVWVPPVIMLDAFAAGYAIPWGLGDHPFLTFWRLIFPLIIVAAICGVAGFYSYRTVRGWQMWTWIAFAISLLNVANLWLFPIIVIPFFPMFVLAIGTIGLFIAALLGAESLKPIHYQVPPRTY